MGRISEKNVEKVIEANNIVDVISEFVPLKKTGRNYMGVCPFHGDKGPSMSVSEEKQLYHCFGCGASGNAVGFIMKIRNLDFVDAIKYLADRAGIAIETEYESPEKKKFEMMKERIYSINIEAARFFFNNLKVNSKPLKYFKDRKIDERTIKKFGLGYSRDSWDALYNHLRSKGFDDAIIEKAGLILKKQNGYYDRFRNRVMFPVFDIKGRVIGFGGRVLDQSKPKYLNSPETPVFFKGTNLYGLNFVIKSGLPDYIIIVEGYMDCISLHQHGINCAAASLGTALTIEQAKLIKRYSKKIYICYDADTAGQTATLRGLEVLEQVGCEVRVVAIPVGKDPDEFIQNNGVEKFLKLIDDAIPIVDFRIQMTKNGKNLKDIRQKSIFVKEVAKILSKMESNIDVQAYAGKIFDETGIAVENILDEVKNIKGAKEIITNNKANIRNNNIGGNIYNLEPAYKKAERCLLKYSLTDKNTLNFIAANLGAENFITPVYKIAAEHIFQKSSDENVIKPQDLLIKFQDSEDISEISRIFEIETQEIEKGIDVNKLVEDCIKTIKRFNIESRINELTIEIKKSEANNNVSKSAVLSQELITLQKQLNLL